MPIGYTPEEANSWVVSQVLIVEEAEIWIEELKSKKKKVVPKKGKARAKRSKSV